MPNRSRILALSIAAVAVALGTGRSYAQAYSYTTLDHPSAAYTGFPGIILASGTFVYGISGDTVVGCYSDATGSEHAFSATGGVSQQAGDDGLERIRRNARQLAGKSRQI